MNQNQIYPKNKKSPIIGYSSLGKPLSVKLIGNKESALRIFIIAGQHGDEKYSGKATSKLVDHFKHISKHSFYAAVLTDANPDGYEKNTRENSKLIDLNRDHLLLTSKEAESIHSFVRNWKPDIVIDVHNYPSRRKHLLKKHLILDHDIFVDIPTNPAIISKLDGKKIDEFFAILKSDLCSKKISCERYVIFQKSGKIRHSTIDVKDARNSISLRYDLFGIILEGKEPLRKEGITGEEKIISAQYTALCSVVNWVVKNKKEFKNNKPHIPTKGELVPIRAHYGNSNKILTINLKNSKTKKIEKVSFKEYSPDVEITKFISIPNGYAVPNSHTSLLSILKKHGFSCNPKTNVTKEVEVYYLKESKKEHSKKRIKKKTKEMSLSSYTVFSTAQTGGRFLALLLEPQSKFGLYRFSALDLSFSNLEYPVLRII